MQHQSDMQVLAPIPSASPRVVRDRPREPISPSGHTRRDEPGEVVAVADVRYRVRRRTEIEGTCVTYYERLDDAAATG